MTKTMAKTMEKSEETGIELEIVRDFDASPEMVFDAWTDAEALRQWMGPNKIQCPNATANAEPGGDYCFPMELENGGTSTAVGHYTAIERPYKLAFTWSWLQDDNSIGQPMHVSLEFERLDGDRTRLKMYHVNFVDESSKVSHNEGWVGCFNSLDGHLNTQ